GHKRRRRHAGVQEQAHRRADSGGRAVRRFRRREVASVLVRPARREDAAAIADVRVLTWQTAYEHVFGAERLAGIGDRRRAQWKEWPPGSRPDRQVFVAEEAGRVVGFVSTGDSRDEPGKGELFAIYVLPDAWGSGAGPALMATALDALRGYSSATLWVLEDNP